MRHLTSPHGQRGLTLVELMVGLAIAAILMMAAAPTFSEFSANSRLRENGHTLFVQALLAQSEAIKRNSTVRLSTSGSKVQVHDRRDPANPVLLAERQLSDGVTLSSATLDFGGEGRPVGFATAAIDLSAPHLSCSSTIRCPGLRIDGGGAVRLCSDQLTDCS